MATIEFTPQLARHVECPSETVSSGTLREAFQEVFLRHPRLKGYILDDQGSVRQHVAVFVDRQLLHDRECLDVPLTEDSSVFVMQALSGG